MAKTEKTYKEAIAELNAILTAIENDDMDVDNLSAEVRKATELIVLCKNKLFKADEELKKVLKDLEA